MREKRLAAKVIVSGIVQGVGFRPFVYRLAVKLGLGGYVLNTGRGVEIHVEGKKQAIISFLEALKSRHPPLAEIESISVGWVSPLGANSFEIKKSKGSFSPFPVIPPDAATCSECLKELFDPQDRRYLHPFISCTNCGPRFTIVTSLPYDRDKTTMADFEMCKACSEEYHDPLSRRFHTQTVSCWNCGPMLFLEDACGRRIAEGTDAIRGAAEALRKGKIVAIKGLGGFHLAVDATNDEAVRRLRLRKKRPYKPFAVMVGSMERAKEIAYVSLPEERELKSYVSPIVLLKARKSLSQFVSPNLSHYGVFLPYTPVHHLLFHWWPEATLVMTSGNAHEEPICASNEEAHERIKEIADLFLLHDRGIATRCDDSVVKVVGGRRMVIRRARGFVPRPIRCPYRVGFDVLAIGSDLKNTFSIARGEEIIPSQHIGDLANPLCYRSFLETLKHFRRLFGFGEEVVVCDKHPSYVSSSFARSLPVRRVEVQHHYAHIASALADRCFRGKVIGFAFDGTGYGDDGAIWGGEVMLADLKGYKRVAHVLYFHLPLGDEAVENPCLTASSLLREALGDVCKLRGTPLSHFIQIAQGLPDGGFRTSSMGRLFDAVSALCGVCLRSTYEGQAPMELEARARPTAERYPLDKAVRGLNLDPKAVIRMVVEDLLRGLSPGEVSFKFHMLVADYVCFVARKLREETGIAVVALGGGVFQNGLLTEAIIEELSSGGFDVLVPEQVPINDGGISVGQAAHACAVLGSD